MKRLAVLLAACGRIGFAPDRADAPVATDAACTLGPPQHLDEVVQSNGQDWEPAVSPDGNVLIFSSTRLDPTSFTTHLFRSDRTGTTWTAPVQVLAIGNFESGPEWNASGTTLYFVSDDAGSSRLFQAPFDSLGFGSAMLVPGLESVDAQGPAVSHDELELFYTTPDASNSQLVRVMRDSTSQPWEVDGPVTELNQPTGSLGWPTLTPDALTMYFEWTVDVAVAPADIYVTTRDAVGMPFHTPAKVTDVDLPTAEDGDPNLAPDGSLYFASDRDSPNESDLYLAPCQ